jgi:RNA-directed DNA polymerase
MKQAKTTAQGILIIPMGEGMSATLLHPVAVVHREKCGRVSQRWLSACAVERASTRGLMERITEPLNLMRSYRKVVSNAGSAGVDGMAVKELKGWLRRNYSCLKEQLEQGLYRPDAVREAEIPKSGGGVRKLGIPTVIDRLIQQAIHQVLSIGYEPTFSESSYGFRPKRSAHQALRQGCNYVSSGKNVIVDLDLEKFFDRVNHDRLMWLLSRRIGDNSVLALIRLYLQSGIMQGGLTSQRTEGTPQGSPLSPLLSNIVLDEMDKELERRGLSYVRYADDVKIFVRSEKAATRVKHRITAYITAKLKLRVNEQKSRICKGYELNFLGHSLLHDGTLGLSEQSEARLKSKVRQITRRNRGVNMEQMLKELQVALRGWLQYFKFARMGKKIDRIDGWIRRKLRCVRLKQCKRTIGIVRWLRSLGMSEKRSWLTALSGKGWWRISNSPAVNEAMNIEWFVYQGFYSLSLHYHRK